MSKYKILFKISGSIAAYKSAYLISKLIQNGCEVRCVATRSALEFIGTATLEGLTGNPVLVAGFERGELMSHINLVKWADLTILAPASGNTINKFASGIADNLVTSLFLAHDWRKPYLIAPAMNTAMYYHPATQASLKKLAEWGINILPTDEGRLACGDTGKGKMLDPDKIFEIILPLLKKENTAVKIKKGKVIITSGGTRESIDGVRFISNMSTGKTGASIAQYFSEAGWDVTFLHAENSALPDSNCSRVLFAGNESLENILYGLISDEHFDAVIHLAAVSDFKIKSIEFENETVVPPVSGKISSSVKDLKINLTSTKKLVDDIKKKSKNKNLVLTAFKFTASPGAVNEVDMLFDHSGADFVVLNSPADRTPTDEQRNFQLFDKNKNRFAVKNAGELAVKLENLIFEKIT